MLTRHKLVSRVSKPQHDFVNSAAKYPAFVGGFGSGKTGAGIKRTIRLKWKYPKQNVAYYLPTYDLVTQIGYPRFEEELLNAGVKYRLNKQEHVIRIPGFGRIIFRTLDRPERIVGFEVADSIVDELDTLPQEKAEEAWNKIIARNRQKKPDGALNTVGVATTPEGFRFVYKRWQEAPAAGYELIRASTYSNARNLPADYIETLKATYPAQLIAAYLEGLFVNLTSGAVYPDFDRVMNGVADPLRDDEILHIGLDFNVYNCTAVICVIRNNAPVVVGELTGMRDTPHVIQTIKEKFPGRSIAVYPDASGQSNKTVNATESDVTLLRQAGFKVMVKPANPFVKERVMSVNAQIKNMVGARALKVNVLRCPVLTKCLEQQVYDKNGEPDKTDGKDHAPDALGYFIHYHWAIAKPSAQITKFRI